MSVSVSVCVHAQEMKKHIRFLLNIGPRDKIKEKKKKKVEEGFIRIYSQKYSQNGKRRANPTMNRYSWRCFHWGSSPGYSKTFIYIFFLYFFLLQCDWKG